MRAVLSICSGSLMAITIGCGGQSAKPPSTVATPPKASPVAKDGPVVAKPPIPTDPLEIAARSLGLKQVRIELMKAEPAGEKDEVAEYEWVVLARIIELPENMTINGPRSFEPGWAVSRIRLRFEFDKSADDFAIGKDGSKVPKIGVRQLQMHVRFLKQGEMPGLFNGQGEQNYDARPGTTPMTLRMKGGLPNFEVTGAGPISLPENLLEVPKARLDDLVQPVQKEAETFEGSRDIELLKVSGKSVVLKVVR
jgi:hypothetical protein